MKESKFYLASEIARDSSRSVMERQMATLIARGHSDEGAIRKHAEMFYMEDSESAQYFDIVMSGINASLEN